MVWLKTKAKKSAENLPGFVRKWFHKSFGKPWITLVRVSTSGPWRLDQLSISDREPEAILSLTRASNLVLLIINSGKLALAIDNPETKHKRLSLQSETFIPKNIKQSEGILFIGIIENYKHYCQMQFLFQN